MLFYFEGFPSSTIITPRLSPQVIPFSRARITTSGSVLIILYSSYAVNVPWSIPCEAEQDRYIPIATYAFMRESFVQVVSISASINNHSLAERIPTECFLRNTQTVCFSKLERSSHSLEEKSFLSIYANKTEAVIYRCIGQCFANRCPSAVVRNFCRALNV